VANREGVAAQGDRRRREIVTPERWKQVEAVFEQALELPAEARQDFFHKMCNGDEELRREVESLLQAHARAGNFIDKRSLFFSGESLEENDAAVRAGQLIGSYRIVREIGRGGMGAVYLAERADEQYKKRVAIKLIKRGMDTDSMLRRFRNERQILAAFDHPTIARLFDAGTTTDGLPYFVMEYVEGLAINEYCAAHKISLVEKLKLFREVCAAVSYAHRHTVIHRDIKMSNILVTSDGIPKLLDFGIAKILQPGDEPEALMTMTGVRPMTPEYASPEQVRGEPVTTASDVYSLGIVLYELLVGHSPYRFTSHSPLHVAREITDTEPPRPSTALARDEAAKLDPTSIRNSKALKGDLDNIVLMALRKEPARRYQSVEQFSEDIRRHLEARPVIARRDTIGYRTAKFIRRNKVATAAALLVFVSLVAGLIGTTWQAQRARAEKARAERRFNDVRRLARSVLFDYHDAIKNLPGATRVREQLVKDALVYLDSLAREAGGDPALQRELAAAYERVGDVTGEAYGASLGDRAGALQSYEKALRVREALVAAAPTHVQGRRDLAGIYRRIGTQLLETKDATRGVEYLKKSLALCSSLAEELPGDRDIRHQLAESYNSVGPALLDIGDTAGALRYLHKALPIYEELLESNPLDRGLRRSLSVVYHDISRTLFLTNDTKGALENNERALVLRERLVTEDPTNADYRRILAVSYQDNGDYLAWTKDTAGALENFRKKLAIDEQSVAADPANAQAAGDLAYSTLRIGELLANSGEYEQATGFFSRAADAYVKSAALDPKEELLPMRVASAHARLAGAYGKLGKIAPAHDRCDRAAKVLSASVDDAASTMARRLRAIAYGDLAEAYTAVATSNPAPHDSAAKDWRTARDTYQRSLELLENLKKQGILDAEELPELDNVRKKIADCEAALAK
jgi:serine/threonine protein kinase/tetratricopeptide (TPR) repeat protein